jgi:small subunit ribosomal protein S18
MTRMITRRWSTGDVYAPHDLSAEEMEKWRVTRKMKVDACDALCMDPLSEYKVRVSPPHPPSHPIPGHRLIWLRRQNFTMLSEFVSPIGKILHSKQTGLRPRNQRKMAKAIRRMVGMGFMPSVHKHPEILLLEAARSGNQLTQEAVAKPGKRA